MEVHEKLRHLSEDQVEEVINLYLDNSYKLDDITNKYSIDINPRNLVSILPPIKTNDFCEYCNVKLVQYIKNRKYSRDNLDNSTCPKCGHVYVRGLYSTEVCNCSNCKKKNKEYMKLLSKKIKEVYTLNLKKYKFDLLTLQEKFTLINLMKSNISKNYQYLHPLIYQSIDYIDPPEYIIDDYNSLIHKNIILISPYNNIDAFDESNFPYEINIAKAKFDVNVEFTKSNLYELEKGIYFKNLVYGDEELIELWKDLLYDDAINYFKTMLNNRQLDLVFNAKADYEFRNMISELSHTQILYLCNRVAKNLSDKCIQNDRTINRANNDSYSYLNNLYKYYIKMELPIHYINYYEIGDRLLFFIECVLDKPITILNKPPSIELLKDETVEVELQDIES